MKKIITLACFVLFCQLSFAQVWKNLDSVTAQVDRGTGFSIAGKGYIFGGNYFGNSGNMWAYDTLSNTWTHVTSYPSDSVDGVVSCSVNGIGYAGTGAYCCYQFGNAFFKYDPTAGVGGTWTRLTDFPGAGRAYAVAFNLDGKVYIGGGLTSTTYGSTVTTFNDFYCYDPVKNTWSAIASCPASGVSCDAVAFVIGDTAYVGTGGKINSALQSVTQDDFWKYDTTSKAWTQIASITGKRAEGAAFSTCDRGYVGLGYTDSSRNTDHNDFWQYNPAINTWTQIANYGGGARNCPEAFTIGKTGYVVGGATPTGFVHEDLWSYKGTVTPAFSAKDSICAGEAVTFTDTSNYSPASWLWNFQGGTPDTSSMQNPTITYNTPGNYDVTLTSWNGCDSGSKVFTQYITVGAGLVVGVLPANPQVCSGQSVTLKASGGTSYQWVGTSDATDSIVVSPSKDTTYELLVSNGICSKDTFITVHTGGVLTVNVQPSSSTVCTGNSVTLKATGGNNYSWTPATGLSTTSGDSAVANPTVDVTYTVTATDSLGCSGTAFDTITVVPAPNVPTITQHGDTLISSAATDNQWYLNGSLISGATNQYLVIGNSSESYTVVVDNPADGCTSTSASLVTSGINQVSINSDQLSIYPNPTSNQLTIISKQLSIDKIELTNVLGQCVFSSTSLKSLPGDLAIKQVIDLSGFADGVYFIRVVNKTGERVFKVVKE